MIKISQIAASAALITHQSPMHVNAQQTADSRQQTAASQVTALHTNTK
jgi:hypothetical protein